MTPEKDREKDIALKEQLEGGNESEDAKGDQVEGLEAAQSDLSLEERIKELEEQVNKNYDLYIRTYAEMENLKKRFQKERESYLKYGQEGLLRSLLPVLDNLEAAMEHLKRGSDQKAIQEGLEMTLRSFYEALEKAGVSRIEAKGRPFDPNLHEALMEQEHEGDSKVVLEELQKGYMLYDRLLRPTKVVISKSAEKTN